MPDDFICPYDGSYHPIADASAEHIIPDVLGGTLLLQNVSKFWNNFMSVSFEQPFINSTLGRELKFAIIGPPAGKKEFRLGIQSIDGVIHLRTLQLVNGKWQYSANRRGGKHFSRSIKLNFKDINGLKHNYEMHLLFEYIWMHVGSDEEENEERVCGLDGKDLVTDYLSGLYSGEIPQDNQRDFFNFLESNRIVRDLPEIRITQLQPSDRVDLLEKVPMTFDVRKEHVEKLIVKIAFCYAVREAGPGFVTPSPDGVALLEYLRSDLIPFDLAEKVRQQPNLPKTFPNIMRWVKCGGQQILIWSDDGVDEIDNHLKIINEFPAYLVDLLRNANGMRRHLRKVAMMRFRMIVLPEIEDTLLHRMEWEFRDDGSWLIIRLFGGLLAADVRISSRHPATSLQPFVEPVMTNWEKSGGIPPSFGTWKTELVPK